MELDVQIKLQMLAYSIENGVHGESIERESTVWAKWKSATRAEFYAAEQNGHKVTDVFSVYAWEYKGEQQILVMETEDHVAKFDVIRTFQTDVDRIELMAERRRGR